MQRFLANDHDDWYYIKFGDPLIQVIADTFIFMIIIC